MSNQVEQITLLCALNGKDFTGITFAFAAIFEIELLEISVSHRKLLLASHAAS